MNIYDASRPHDLSHERKLLDIVASTENPMEAFEQSPLLHCDACRNQVEQWLESADELQELAAFEQDAVRATEDGPSFGSFEIPEWETPSRSWPIHWSLGIGTAALVLIAVISFLLRDPGKSPPTPDNPILRVYSGIPEEPIDSVPKIEFFVFKCHKAPPEGFLLRIWDETHDEPSHSLDYPIPSTALRRGIVEWRCPEPERLPSRIRWQVYAVHPDKSLTPLFEKTPFAHSP